MQDLKKKGYQDRSKINMHEPHEVQFWTKHLGVSIEQLQKAVDKVATVRLRLKRNWRPEAPRAVNGARYSCDHWSRARALFN
jgi:hypothetical protein